MKTLIYAIFEKKGEDEKYLKQVLDSQFFYNDNPGDFNDDKALVNDYYNNDNESIDYILCEVYDYTISKDIGAVLYTLNYYVNDDDEKYSEIYAYLSSRDGQQLTPEDFASEIVRLKE